MHGHAGAMEPEEEDKTRAGSQTKTPKRLNSALQPISGSGLPVLLGRKAFGFHVPAQNNIKRNET